MTDSQQPPYQPTPPPSPQGYAPQPPQGYAPQAPQGYAPQPPVGSAPQPPVDAQPKRNILGLIALVIAVVGFIFACVPGALIVGWVLLPIAFVLSIISLFMKGKKLLGIIALVVSVIGTIVGFVVFFVVAATTLDLAFDEALGDSDTSVTQPAEGSEGSTEGAPATDDAAGGGSRENPAAIGSTITGDEWTVVVNSFTPDATQIVAEANQFNEPAPAGSHYATLNYTVTYTGADSGLAPTVGVALVTSTGEVLENYEALVLLSDAMGLDELYAGGTATGSAAFTVPDGTEVLIRVRPGILADEVFVQP